jgi:twinkle protein
MAFTDYPRFLPALELWAPPWPEWESKFMLAPTCFSVGTGYPKHGKTTLAQQMWAGIVKTYNFPVLILSAETRVRPWVRMNLRMAYWNKAQGDMSLDEKNEADEWIEQMFVFMGHPDANPTFPWVMDKIEAAVVRDGVRGVLLDPWNKLTDTFDNETRWVGQCLDTIAACCKGLNIHIMILAHPTKGDFESRKKACDPYAISGSAHWYNKPDQLFSIHRPVILDENGEFQRDAVFHHWACRYEELGRPAELPMRMSKSGIFKATEFESKLAKELKDV